MMLGKRAGALRATKHIATGRGSAVAAWGGKWGLVATLALNFLGYVGWFLVLHLRSVGWAPGQVLEPLTGYWTWFYQHVFSVDQVYAVRQSTAARFFPWLEIAAVSAVGLSYWLLLRQLRRVSTLGLRALLGITLLFSVPLLVLPNLLSGDVYSYIAFGRIGALLGGNPFIDPPMSFPNDPMYQWVGWRTVASVYGPAWVYPSMLVTLGVEALGGHVITYVLAYKLLALGLHLCNGALIWHILQRGEHTASGQQTWGTALYLLNPLALIEFAGNAHNDALMITFVLLAVLAHQRGWWLRAVLALTLATLTKWVALPLLGLYGVLLLWQSQNWRERGWRTLASLLLFGGVSVCLYAPYWENSGTPGTLDHRNTLRILVDAPPQKRFINSLGDMAVSEWGRLQWQLGNWADPALLDLLPPTPIRNISLDEVGERESWQSLQQTRYDRWAREHKRLRDGLIAKQTAVQATVRWACLAALGAVCLAAVALTRTTRSWLTASAWVLFAYVAIGAVWVWPWYATWFVALAALLDWRVTGRTAVLVSVLALLLYPLFPLLPTPTLTERLRAVLVFGLPLAFALWQALQVLRGWRGRAQHPKQAQPVAEIT